MVFASKQTYYANFTFTWCFYVSVCLQFVHTTQPPYNGKNPPTPFLYRFFTVDKTSALRDTGLNPLRHQCVPEQDT